MKNLFILVSVLFCGSVLTTYSQTAQQRTLQTVQPQIKIQKLPPQNGPDLVITNVTGVPEAITSLDPNGECPYFFASITVQNIGNQDAWFPSNTWIIGGESQYTNISAPGQITNSRTTVRKAIKAGESWMATLAGKVKCLRTNPVTISFMVDPENRVAETVETNNVWSKSVPNLAVPGLGQQPDLIIQRVWFTPEHPDYYSDVLVHLEIKNVGAGPAVFCGSDIIWMSQIEGKSGGGGGAGPQVILPNEVRAGGITVAGAGILTNGCYRVFVQVDPRNSIAESNENNNSRTAYLSIGGASCQDLVNQDTKVRATINLQNVPLQTKSTQPLVPVH